MMYLTRVLVPTMLAVSVGLLPSAASESADASPLSSPAVLVVLKESFPQTHIAAVVRRTPGANGQDIIAIRRSAASPELLGAALTIVAKSRERQGATVARKATIVIPVGVKLPPLSEAEKTRLGEAISQLLTAAPSAVPAVGHVPSISLNLTP
jgi:hypothetical protein